MLLRSCAALLAATVLTATPAVGRDKTLYVGIEAGPSWASNLNTDIVFRDEEDLEEDFINIDHKMGYDVGVIFGYDAGIVRAELDLSYKRWAHDEYDLFGQDGETTIDGDGSTRYIAIMTNLLLDVGNEDGLSFYAGPGAGFAWGKFKIEDETGDDFNFKDGGVAWQLIAGVRYALNPNVDLGLKYRYFHPSRITEDLDEDGDVRAEGRMHSHSLLATLTYNFYTPPPPPPPPLPPPPPPPPPATQTCPDGSVILATDVCPLPPPPPPPPPPEPERG